MADLFSRVGKGLRIDNIHRFSVSERVDLIVDVNELHIWFILGDKADMWRGNDPRMGDLGVTRFVTGSFTKTSTAARSVHRVTSCS